MLHMKRKWVLLNASVQAYFALLHFILLRCVFYKLKARPSTSKRIMTGFIVAAWTKTVISLGYACLNKYK